MDTMAPRQQAHLIGALGAAIPPAIIVTTGLIALMYSLIATDYVEPEITKISIDTSVFEPPKEPTKPIVKKLEPIEPVMPPERLPTDAPIENVNLQSESTGIAWKPPGTNLTLTRPNSGPIPSLRVEPTYPSRALQRGIEGYVDLMFDITATGSTENIRVIGGEPGKVFDQAAVKAVSRWKYQPEYIENQSVRSIDQVTRLIFAIED